MSSATTVGTLEWSRRTGGRLEPAERRRLVADLARGHVTNAVGRLRLAAHLHPGRNAYVRTGPVAAAGLGPDPRRRPTPPPASCPRPLLNHSHRTYQFGRAVGELEGSRRRRRAAVRRRPAARHRPGPGRRDATTSPSPPPASLGTSPSRWACPPRRPRPCRRPSPCTTAPASPSTPARSPTCCPPAPASTSSACAPGSCPRAVLERRRRDHPRAGFKKYFAEAWADEAARVPRGRARLLRRYGAFSAAIRLAPFDE